MATALGVSHLDELGERVAKLLDLKLPGTFSERLAKLGTLFDLVKAGPKRVSGAPCQELVETARPSLAGLPGAGRPTAAATSRCRACSRVIRGRASATSACSRLQVFDERTLGMHWQTQGRAEHHRVAEEHAASGPRMPVAIAPAAIPR